MKKITLILTIAATIAFSSSSIVSGADTGSMAIYNSVADISNEKSCQAKFLKSLGTLHSGNRIVKDVPCEVDISPIVFRGLKYYILKSPNGTGRHWLDRNLGATEACIGADNDNDGYIDIEEDCFGHLYQWGRNDDGHEDRTNTSTTSTKATDITNAGTTLFITGSDTDANWASVDSDGALRVAAWKDGGSNDICPPGFSVPTEDELVADTINATTIEVGSSISGAYSFHKLSLGGYRDGASGVIKNLGNGILWSRTLSSKFHYGVSGRAVFYGTAGAGAQHLKGTVGASVRCIMDWHK